MASRSSQWCRKLLAGFIRQPFARDDRAAVSVEFAILALPFFAVLGAILETSLVFLATNILDSAVNDASRQIRTGQAQAAAFNTTKFEKLVCDRLYGMFKDCSGLYSSVTIVNDFKSATAVAPVQQSCTSSCTWTRPEDFSPGTGSNIVMVQVYYRWPLILSIGGFDLANMADHSRLLGSVRVFRNEPF